MSLYTIGTCEPGTNIMSSLDRDTDTKIQDVIRESFQDCTVIVIALRIRTLLDFDPVIMLSNGQIIEQGNPQELADRKHGEFYRLLEFEA